MSGGGRGRKGHRRRELPLGDVSDATGTPSLAHDFLEHLKASGFSEQTVKNRRMYLRLFISFCEERGVDRPADVSPSFLDAYQRHVMRAVRKKDAQPISAASKTGRLITVKTFFSWLTKKGHLLMNPASELVLPKEPQKLPRTLLDVHQVEAVMSAPDIETPIGLRDRAILEVLYSTGIRRKEVLNLHLSDLSADRGVLLIRDGKGKKDRMVPIGERALAWVDKYLADSRPWLFEYTEPPEHGALDETDVLFLSSWGGALSGNSVSCLCRKYLDAAGISAGGAHVFRHTMATLMLEGGADVRYLQEMLGHAQLSTTQVYTRVSIEKLKEVHALTHPAKLPSAARKELLK